MILWHTITMRWWALLFVPVFFWAARGERSWRDAARFYAISVVVSFAAEYASTHTGIPYGRYAYETATRGRELFVSNVPLFVPLTFGVVVWAGRAVAARRARSPLALIAGTALAATLLDMAIDPMTVRGGEWFLGPLYRYAHPRGFFGVPWSNFVGWLIVSALIVAVDAALGGRGGRARGGARGALVAAGIAAFFTVIGVITRHETIPATAAAITLAVYAIGIGARSPRHAVV